MDRRGILIALMLVFSLSVGVSTGRQAEYLTELELDRIRETQDVERRIPLFLEIARVRLGHLGLTGEFQDLDAAEEESVVARAMLAILQPGTADEIDQPTEEKEDFEHDLTRFTHAELLQGYYQALEEAMDNIDDVFERRRGDIRKPLETLKDFTNETLPMLERYDPATEDERIALANAIEQARLALEGAERALEIIPKTEQK